MARSGDKCEACGTGRYVVTSRDVGQTMVTQYLRCNTCRHKPANNKVTRLIEQVFTRNRKPA